MRLHENQLKLINHLARFNLLDYASCLHMLDTAGTEDQVALSYAFRPLAKNKYLTKRMDGSVSILARGRGLFLDIKPLISAGGGEKKVPRLSVFWILTNHSKSGASHESRFFSETMSF